MVKKEKREKTLRETSSTATSKYILRAGGGEKKKKNKNNARVWEIIRSSNQIRRWNKFFISMLTAGILIKIELLTDQQFTVSAIGK